MSKAIRPRILLAHISPGVPPSFVRTDMEVLRAIGDIRVKFFGSLMDLPGLAYGIGRVDLVVCWFAWSQAFWATRISRLLGKPSIIIAGGFEVVGIKEIGYGGLLKPRSAKRVRSSLLIASEVVAVSRSMQEEIVRISGRSDTRLVPLGFDPARHPFSDMKERLVITVAGVNQSNLVRKGLLDFVEAAKGFPDVGFMIIGDIEPSSGERLRLDLPVNVTLTGWVGNDELTSLMKRAKVYVQLSAHEGFGSAVAEAMLAGCIPVVTARGALPEVVGSEGFVVPWRDIEAARESIARALRSPTDASHRSRARIAQEFPIDRRRRALSEIVSRALTL
jgi:glycosyltransferase involved in cell wall biosynthesis